MSTCPLPKGKINNETIESIALLALEESSPFHPNDIFWGYTIDVESSIIHIFSALKSRIKAIDETAEVATYILPEFIIPLLDHSITKAILKYGESTIFYDKNANHEITFFSTIPTDPAIPIFELQEIRAIFEFGVTIHYTKKINTSTDPVEKIIEFPFHQVQLIGANMQNSVLKKANKQCKIITNLSFSITVFAIIISLVTLGGLVTFQHMLRKEKKSTVALLSKDEQVKKIQQKDERAHELDLFSNKKHVYFRGLDKINALRPESILFEQLYASEGENFEIKCSSRTLEDIDKFEKILNESSLFKVVKIENKNVQNLQDGQKFTFSLFLTFKKI
jgi:hypothetical protein